MARSKKGKGRNHKKSNNKKGKGGNVFIPKFHTNQKTRIGGRYSGVLEINQKGYGFIRKLDFEFSYSNNDPFLKPDEVRHYDLRSGLILEGEFEEDQSGNRHVHSIEKVNGNPSEFWQKINRFELQTPIMPVEQIKLGHNAEDHELRVMDLISPVGRGQRALIVAPPRTGKTVLLKKIARSISENYGDISTAILLVDERLKRSPTLSGPLRLRCSPHQMTSRPKAT
jgi:transcription termination factor Rho